jgi:peptidase M48-like protein
MPEPPLQHQGGMTRLNHRRRLQTSLLAVAVTAATFAGVDAQTRITAPKNSYSVQQDVELGREASAEVRKEMPVLNDSTTRGYVERIGAGLVEAIPQEFQHPEFHYTFDVVNLKEINAFALPGGPMFLNRGMLEAAKTDGEVAGVMAHELSHVMLRHGTAQATRGQKFQIGAIAGQVLGAIVGGRTGSVIANGSQIGLGTYFLKYSREYERDADILGAQLMARAGYDPRQMANMFKTIEQQGGSNGPEFLSDHPNPGNRYAAINREADSLRIARNADTNGIQSVHARLSQMPPALSTAQVARNRQGGGNGESGRPVGTSGRPGNVEPPAGDWQTVQPGSFLRFDVPANWRRVGGGNTVTYAPDGGYVESGNGQSSFTHGLEVGVMQSDNASLEQRTDQLIQGFASTNPQLRRQGGYSRTTIDGRQGLTTTLSNVSDLTGEPEAIDISTVQLRDGSVLFLIGVAPQREVRTYRSTFGHVRQSLQLNDR